MVDRLRADGLVDARVLDALAHVPRHLFIDAALVGQAYEDTSLPIGHGQTISKPSVVARMIELLYSGANARRSGRLGRVLEIGSGCGYQAALLARLSTQVISVERLKALHDKARTATEPHDDGFHGLRATCRGCGAITVERTDAGPCPLCEAPGPLRARPGG